VYFGGRRTGGLRDGANRTKKELTVKRTNIKIFHYRATYYLRSCKRQRLKIVVSLSRITPRTSILYWDASESNLHIRPGAMNSLGSKLIPPPLLVALRL
jgi:hypothetical protein